MNKGQTLTWRHWGLIFTVALACLLPGTFTIPPTDRDESRYAVATAQMVESGDYVDIRFQDSPRHLQPAGIYWLQAAAVSLFGEAEHPDIALHRIPSLVGALIAIAMTGLLATSLFGSRAGTIAALLLAASIAVGVEGRMAKTDAVLLATVISAQFALVQIYMRQNSRLWIPMLFWIALGAGLMVKGPIILIFVGLTIAALVVWDRDGRWILGLRPLLGIPVFLLVVLPWYVAIGIQSDWAFYTAAVGQNLFGKVGESQQAHVGPPGYHLAAFTLAFWPGSLFVVYSVLAVWRRHAEPGIKFLIAWIIPAWIVFELVATKLPHYVLPTYPALAALAGMALVSAPSALDAKVKWVAGLYGVLWLMVSGVLAALGPAALWWSEDVISPLFIGLALIAFGLAVAAFWLFASRRRMASVGVAILSGLLISVSTFGGVIPRLDTIWLSPRIVSAVEAARPCHDSLLISPSYREPSLVFLYGPSLVRLDTPQRAAHSLHQNADCAVALIDASDLDVFLAGAAELGLSLRNIGTIEGLNYSKGDEMDLNLFVVGDGGAS